MTDARANRSALNILIVEDDPLLRTVMSLQLTASEITVRLAATGCEALKMIAECVPSVLILDVGLPDMTGLDVVEQLRTNPATCSLPLIIHTTLELSSKEQAQLQLGRTRFVTKTTALSYALLDLVLELAERGPVNSQ